MKFIDGFKSAVSNAYHALTDLPVYEPDEVHELGLIDTPAQSDNASTLTVNVHTEDENNIAILRNAFTREAKGQGQIAPIACNQGVVITNREKQENGTTDVTGRIQLLNMGHFYL